jgi:hypothetical protein
MNLMAALIEHMCKIQIEALILQADGTGLTWIDWCPSQDIVIRKSVSSIFFPFCPVFAYHDETGLQVIAQ